MPDRAIAHMQSQKTWDSVASVQPSPRADEDNSLLWLVTGFAVVLMAAGVAIYAVLVF